MKLIQKINLFKQRYGSESGQLPSKESEEALNFIHSTTNNTPEGESPVKVNEDLEEV